MSNYLIHDKIGVTNIRRELCYIMKMLRKILTFRIVPIKEPFSRKKHKDSINTIKKLPAGFLDSKKY